MSDLDQLEGKTIKRAAKTKSETFDDEVTLVFDDGTKVIFLSSSTDYGDSSEIHVEIKEKNE